MSERIMLPYFVGSYEERKANQGVIAYRRPLTNPQALHVTATWYLQSFPGRYVYAYGLYIASMCSQTVLCVGYKMIHVFSGPVQQHASICIVCTAY